jgi:hypothetical protein
VRRFPLAFVLVGLLGLLAAGGAVLGAFEAPTGSNLAVHNGANQTLLAARVKGSYTTSQYTGLVISFDYRAPDHSSEVARGPGGKVEGRRSVTGGQAISVLGPVRQLLGITNFSLQGAYYSSAQPASVLVPAATRAKVTGTYQTRVQLETGYVVAVFVRIDAHDGTQHVLETMDYELSRVGGWIRSS